MPHDPLPPNEQSLIAASTAGTDLPPVHLLTAGTRISMSFAPELADLASAIRDLWAHVVVEDAAEAPALTLRFTARNAPSTGSAQQVEAPSTPSYRLRPDDPSNSFIVSGRVTTSLIRDLAGKRILLHAGAVELPELGTVLVVGPSGAGKSTSTAALGQTGTYLTDELTILDPEDFRVTGYPKPVSRVIDRDGAGASHSAAGNRNKSDYTPDALGLQPGTSGAAPSHILLLDRQSAHDEGADESVGDQGASGPDVGGPDEGVVTAERTPTVEALHTLSAQSSSTWLVDGGLSRLMQLLDHCGGALTVRYREAAALVRQLPQLVKIPPHRPEWRHVPGRASAAPGAGEYAVSTFSDAIALEESFIVLRRGALVSTQGLGALVWDILEMSGALTRDALLEEVIEVLGENDQAEVLLDGALASLLEEKLIVHSAPTEG